MTRSLKFAANLSSLWADLPWQDRFDAAAAAGFTAAEAHFPYQEPMPETQNALRRNGLKFLCMNTPPPNYTGGPRGFAAQPGMETRFAHDLRRSLRYATALNAPFLQVMAGVAEGAEAEATFVANLKSAAESVPEGVTLLIKPLNPEEMPGYALHDFDQAAAILDAVDSPSVALLFDTAHAHGITGDVLSAFEAHAARIAHIQLADVPGRNAPGQGMLPFGALFEAIEASGYAGWISADFQSTGPTEKALGWMNTRPA